jgi:protein SCO1/2
MIKSIHIVCIFLVSFALIGVTPAQAAGSADSHKHDSHEQHKQQDVTPAQVFESVDSHKHDSHEHHKQQGANAEISMAEIDLPAGVSLRNQFGEQVDLRRDVIGDRVVVINFVYTNCTTVCPVTSSIFTLVQNNLGGQMEQQVALITITVDPAHDTPHRLLTYSKNFAAGSAWSWLTGDKKNVDKVLRALGAYTPNFEDHPAMLLIGDERNSKWYRLYGFPAPEAIEARVRDLLNNRSS